MGARQFYRTVVRPPRVAGFERHIADTFISTDFEGVVTGKAAMVADLKAKAGKETVSYDGLKVQVYGDTAIATGITAVKGTYKGKDSTGRYAWTDTWVKRGGQWQCVAGHSKQGQVAPNVFQSRARAADRSGYSDHQPLVLGPDLLRAVRLLEPLHDEVTSGHLLEVVHEEQIDGAAREGANDGHRLCRHLLGDDGAEPRGDGRDEPGKRRRAFFHQPALGDVGGRLGHSLGQGPAHNPVPLSAASSPARLPPRASTSRQESLTSSRERSCPSLRAMSPMERSMSAVDTGSSTGSDARPTAPPAMPEPVTRILWSQSWEIFVSPLPRVRTANSSPLRSAVLTISPTFSLTSRGSIRKPASNGFPARSAIRAVRPGYSSFAFAILSAARSVFREHGPGGLGHRTSFLTLSFTRSACRGKRCRYFSDTRLNAQAKPGTRVGSLAPGASAIESGHRSQ